MKVLLLLLSLLQLLSARELVLATGDSVGFNVQLSKAILTEAYRSLGITITVKYYPWERSLLYSNGGTHDGEVFRLPIIEKNYTNLVRVGVPVSEIRFYVVRTDSNDTLLTWEEIGDKRVSFQRGIKYLQKKCAHMKRTEVATESTGLYLLHHNRVDYYITGRPKPLLLSNDPSLVIQDEPIEKLTLFHYLHRKNRDLVKPLEHVLDSMHRVGRIEELRDSVLNTQIPRSE